MKNKFEKEALVIKLLKEGRTLREIAKEAYVSFGTLGEIKRRIFGESASYTKKNIKLSKNAKALELFSKGKSAIDVSVELDFDPKEVEKVYFYYLRLGGLSNLEKIYQELGNHLHNLIKFYWSFREAGVDNKIITYILDVADELPELNAKINSLRDERNDLEVQIQKKNRNLKYLNDQIEKASNIVYQENSKLENIMREITDKRIEVSNLKKLIEDIKTTDGFLNLERKVEEMVKKIINQNSTNLTLLLVAVLETLRNNPLNQQIISDYSDTFKDANINRQNLQPREHFVLCTYNNLLHEIAEKLLKIYPKKIVSNISKLT
ncbi:MAG: coiled-coil domain-containing protein [Nitrososphaeraceae archaeon]